MLLVTVMMMMAAGRVESITKFERRREAKNDLLSTHCIERSACMRQGGNMMGSLVTEFPFHPPGIQSNRQSCQEACAATENCKYLHGMTEMEPSRSSVSSTLSAG